MAIVALRAWYLEEYEPIEEVIKWPHDLRLSRNSLLKTGLRADFLNEREEIEKSPWFKRYLQGEIIKFYIEGSGGYKISNIDLISQEIYFTKTPISAWLEPIIFFSHQEEYPRATEMLRESLAKTVAQINQRSRIEITIVESIRPTNSPWRPSSIQKSQISQSLLFVADGTSVGSILVDKEARSLLSPHVCLEMGYAEATKSNGQILLVKMARSQHDSNYPLELPAHQQLEYQNTSQLQKTLPIAIENLLIRFNLFARS
ncbi:MAG: hypothetical protein ACFBSE_20810 [Prochloraceae cyanobacterium]